MTARAVASEAIDSAIDAYTPPWTRPICCLTASRTGTRALTCSSSTSRISRPYSASNVAAYGRRPWSSTAAESSGYSPRPMSRIDDLAPDQRAVLQLLLKQGKSYVELATLLRITPDAVRDRAVAALEELGPRDGAQLAPERRAEVADYLLAQQSASERAATREFLEGSAAGRAWARVVAGELRPLAGDALPDVPAEGAEVDEAFDALQAREARRVEVKRSSRVGGMILIVGAIVVAVALILIIRGGGNNKNESASTPPAASTPATQTQPTQPQI